MFADIVPKELLRNIFVSLIFCLFGNHTSAQTYNIQFENISIQNGLSHNNVNCIFQDSRGFLWVGTKEGLNRYDGYNIVTFYSDKNDSTSLSHNFINTIYEDPSHTGLWIGTKIGLSFFNFKSETFQQYLTRNRPNVTAINSVNDDLIIYGTNKGLGILKRQGRTHEVQTYQHIPFKVENDSLALTVRFISCLYKTMDSTIWVSSNEGHLYSLKMDRRTLELKSYPLYKAGMVKGMVEDRSGNLWLATNSRGIVRFDPNTSRSITYSANSKTGLEGNTYHSICKGSEGKIWLGTKELGLVEGYMITSSNKLDTPPVYAFRHHKHESGVNESFIENTVRCVYADRMGVLWAGTRGNGIVKVTSQPDYFDYHLGARTSSCRRCLNEINTLAEDNKNNIWIGSKFGLTWYQPITGRYRHYRRREQTITHDDVFSICTDNRMVWIGTYGGGVNGFNLKHQKFIYLTKRNNNLSSDIITSLVSLQSGDLLIGSISGGVDLITNKELSKVKPQATPLPLEISENINGFINSRKVLLEDSTGEIWVATNSQGVFRYNPASNQTIHYQHIEGKPSFLPTNHVTAVYEDQSGIIWLGTIKGLVRFDKSTDQLDMFSIKDGLPDYPVVGVIGDTKGNIWVLTRNWLSRMNPKTRKVRSFKIGKRITDELFTHNPLFKSRNGKIFVGTQTAGFFSFYPDSIKDLSYLPPLAITDVKVSGVSLKVNKTTNKVKLNESINSLQSLVLKHNNNNLTFEFASLSYLLQEKNQYACILEGAQTEWQFMDGKRRIVNYFDLHPGEYTFRVKASNCDGVWNEAGKSIAITILPPWWKTHWAYALYVMVIILLFAALYYYTYKWIALKNNLTLEKLEKEKITELNQDKLRFFTNISHEFRTPLTLILGPLEKLLSMGGTSTVTEKQYQLMHKNANRLLRLINQLMDFRKVEQHRMKLYAEEADVVSFIRSVTDSFEGMGYEKGIQLSFNSIPEVLLVWFDKDKLDKILFNLLSNAFKFTPSGGNITVHINEAIKKEAESEMEEWVEINIEDTGRGMTPDQMNNIFDRFYQVDQNQTGTGIGLSLSKSLVKMHYGTISVTSEVNNGTCFTISLPLGYKHLKASERVSDKELPDELHRSIILAPETEKNTKGLIDDGDGQPKILTDANAPLIMVVEDNEPLRDFICDNLKQKYRVLQAKDGRQAYDMILEQTPNIIISDVMMPEMDGFELCRTVKTDTRISHIPVILLTALDTVNDKLIGYKEGADDYIPKPFNQGLLEVRIRNLIQSRKELQQRFRKEIRLEPKDITIASADEKLLDKALKVIEENISDPDFTVEKLGQEIGISRVHLYRKIKALTDQTATEFIRTIRLKQAAKLLVQQKITVSEIGFMVGFKNAVSFGRAFKNHFGVTPTEYSIKQDEGK